MNVIETTPLMRGFPPAPDGQVTLANWRTAPFNRWAFQHVREIVPTADIANDRAKVREMASTPLDMGRLRVDALSFEEFLDETITDGIVIVHGGGIVFERYAGGMTAGTPHILMSVSKSLLGLLAGVLAARGELDLGAPVTRLIPEITGSAYDGATIRQLLDMRAGVAFDEDYLATSGPIVAYRKATGWNPLEPGEAATDLRSFYREMKRQDGPHGGRFHYVSPNTDLLGWVIERATGRRYADLMSELVWQPMGAEHGAYITVDRLGAPRCAGGMCATVRDLARVGQLLLADNHVVPRGWVDDVVKNGDAEAWAAGSFVQYFPGLPMRYRSTWYVQDGAAPLLSALGIHGQNLFVDLERGIVIAKVSSQALPLDARLIGLTQRAVSQITRFLGRGGRGACGTATPG